MGSAVTEPCDARCMGARITSGPGGGVLPARHRRPEHRQHHGDRADARADARAGRGRIHTRTNKHNTGSSNTVIAFAVGILTAMLLLIALITYLWFTRSDPGR